MERLPHRFTFYLVNPGGKVVATDAAPQKASGKSGTTVGLYTPHPVPGPLQIDAVSGLHG